MDPAQIFIPRGTPFLGPDNKVVQVWWNFFQDLLSSFTDIDLTTQVTGILPAANAPTSQPILTVTASVGADGGGLKHQRVTTGSIGAGVSALVTVTWPTTFADANYTCIASVKDATAATASLSVVHIESQVAAGVSVRVANGAGGALTGTLEVVAFHD